MRSGSGRPTSRASASAFCAALARRQQAMGLEHLHHLVADPHQRIERRHRLLKHHGDAAAAQVAPAVLVEPEQIVALEDDLAGFGRDTVGQQAHQRMRAHRFAGTGFADHADDLAGHQIERNAIDRVRPFAARRQRDLQVPDRDGWDLRHLSVHSCASRGLSASLRPSPIRLRPSTEIRMAMPGNTVIHHACRITVRPAPTM